MMREGENGDYVVNGFAFQDKELYEQAGREAQGIRFIRSKTDMDNPDMVMQVYRQVISQGLFQTVVGYSFLGELREYLLTVPYIKMEDIPRIEVKNPAPFAKEEVKKEVGRKEKSVIRNPDFKIRFKVCMFLNAVLLLTVIAMFVLAATQDNINILNYKNKITDQYAAWEQELTQREAKLKERERLLQNQDVEEEEGDRTPAGSGVDNGIIYLK